MHRWASYGDSEISDEAFVLRQLNYLESYLPADQFEQLLTRPRAEVRFICRRCTDGSGIEEMDIEAGDIPTAYAISDTEARCVLCEKTTRTRKGHCVRADCDGNRINDEDDGGDECLICGWNAEDLERDARYARPSAPVSP
jgi:hypothetical protein